MKLEFSGPIFFSKNTQISNFMKTHLVGDSFHVDGRTDRET